MDPERVSSAFVSTTECEWQGLELNPVLSNGKNRVHSSQMVSAGLVGYS